MTLLPFRTTTYVVTDAGDRVPRDRDAERAGRLRVLAAESRRVADRRRLYAYAEPTTPKEAGQ